GIERGDRVGVMLPNSFDTAAAWLGLGWVGAYEVPINAAYRGHMLQYALENSGTKAIVISERHLDRLVEVVNDLDGLETIVVPDAGGALPGIAGKSVLGREEFLGGAAPAHDLPVPMPWDLYGILYTSGTTGP